jgi:3-phenylpropionate/cinnamic acid dioxygenase small subunit
VTKAQTQKALSSETASAPKSDRVPVGSALHSQIVEFLYEEAALLDQIRLQEWAARLAPDLIYTAPLRETRQMDQQSASLVRSVQHFHDDWRSVMGRIVRLTGTKSAWAEDPPSRTRRLVTNVLVAKTAKSGEFSVISYLLVTRSRFNSSEYDLISAERRDLLRQDGDSFKLARREIIVDQAVLGTPNFAIFL